MSPEQFEGKAVDGRSDVYSLGVTFYYLLSKGRPYEGQNTVQIIYAILTQQPKALTELNKDVPVELWRVIEKMISKRAEDRYQSLRDTMNDLRRFSDRTQADKAQCPGCGAKNPKGRKFCRGCGAALVVKCPSCAAESPAGATTCSACGADMGRLLRIRKSMDAAARFKSLGDLRRAAESYRQVVELDPTHGEAKAEFDRLAGTLSEVDRVRNETDDLLKTGDLESALGRVEELLRRFPMASEVRGHRDELRASLARRKVDGLVEEADGAERRGAVREAIDLLDQAIRVDAARDDVRARRDELGRRLSQLAESRQRAAKALAAGRFEEAFSLAGEVLKVTPDDAAMEDVRRRAQTSVDSVDQFVRRGQEHLAAKRLSEALGEFEAALSLRPGDAQLLGQVESTRAKITGQRERIAACRRLMADRDFEKASKGLEAVLAELPGDAEARSLISACKKGLEESARTREIDGALKEGDRLDATGDYAAAMAQYDRVLKLDPRHPDAGPRREQAEQRMRGERDIRELANEHLSDGRYADAVAALERLKAASPARAAAVDEEIAECRRREETVNSALKQADAALSRKEYRTARDGAAEILALAPRHPRANAIKKDSDKAIAAIDRFLGECDKLLVSEMFDEALESLDKARERGAVPTEYRPRRESCEQGRLVLLKTDATRSLVARDFEAAIAAYDQVLEVRGNDADALKGKRSAERRIRILTTEPLVLRAGAAAAVLLLLGVVNVTAVAATSKAAITAVDVEVAAVKAANESAGVEKDKRQLEPEVKPAFAAEDAGDHAAARTLFEAQRAIGDFRDRAELVAGSEFNGAMDAVRAKTAPKDRIAALDAAARFLGDAPERRRLRAEAIAGRRNDAVLEWVAAAEREEAADPAAALRTYDEIQAAAKDAPAVQAARAKANYLVKLDVGNLQAKGGRFETAAASFVDARSEVKGDARRTANVDERLTALRGRWIASVAAAGAAAGADDEKWYAAVAAGLERVVRTYAPLGVTREAVLAEYRRAGGR
jgi:tetratricopeptide (TPR) repeat protein